MFQTSPSGIVRIRAKFDKIISVFYVKIKDPSKVKYLLQADKFKPTSRQYYRRHELLDKLLENCNHDTSA